MRAVESICTSNLTNKLGCILEIELSDRSEVSVTAPRALLALGKRLDVLSTSLVGGRVRFTKVIRHRFSRLNYMRGSFVVTSTAGASR